jgi:hypothetical protein
MISLCRKVEYCTLRNTVSVLYSMSRTSHEDYFPRGQDCRIRISTHHESCGRYNVHRIHSDAARCRCRWPCLRQPRIDPATGYSTDHLLSLASEVSVVLVMVDYSQGQPPHDDNDDLSSIYSRPSIIQNSPDWPSVRLPSPGPSVRTLNESNDGKYCDDISSLANFSCEDLDRGSFSTANISPSPSSSRQSTPSSSSHDQYQPQG